PHARKPRGPVEGQGGGRTSLRAGRRRGVSGGGKGLRGAAPGPGPGAAFASRGGEAQGPRYMNRRRESTPQGGVCDADPDPRLLRRVWLLSALREADER